MGPWVRVGPGALGYRFEGYQSISPRAISEAGEPTQCRALNEHPARTRLEVRTRKRFGHNLKFILINQVARPLRFQHFDLYVVVFEDRYHLTYLGDMLYRRVAEPADGAIVGSIDSPS